MSAIRALLLINNALTPVCYRAVSIFEYLRYMSILTFLTFINWVCLNQGGLFTFLSSNKLILEYSC